MDKSLILNEIKKYFGYKKDADFARYLGISPQTLSSWYSRNTFDIELLYAKCRDIEAHYLLTGEGPMLRSDLPAAHPATEPGAGIPLIPIEAVAGLPTDDPVGTRFIDCAHYIIPDFANLNVEYMIRVSGSSMYPKYSNGDILACRRVHDVLFFQWGKIYVIDSSQGALVKRVFQDEDPDRILLVSDNRENYPPFSIPKSDIRSLSIVVGVIRLE